MTLETMGRLTVPLVRLNFVLDSRESCVCSAPEVCNAANHSDDNHYDDRDHHPHSAGAGVAVDQSSVRFVRLAPRGRHSLHCGPAETTQYGSPLDPFSAMRTRPKVVPVEHACYRMQTDARGTVSDRRCSDKPYERREKCRQQDETRAAMSLPLRPHACQRRQHKPQQHYHGQFHNDPPGGRAYPPRVRQRNC